MSELPDGFTVRLSTRVHACDGGRTLVGGSQGSVLFVSAAAAQRLAAGDLVVRDATSRLLARRLLDTGMADPVFDPSGPGSADPGRSGPDPSGPVSVGNRFGPQPNRTDITVVIPVRDRAFALDRLLRAIRALDGAVPVVVVDDASREPREVAVVAARHGVRLVSHQVNLGPAAARNSGLAVLNTSYVCFCDSDVVPSAGWLSRLTRHFDDPDVAMVAPRVLGQEPLAGDGAVARYEQASSSLDLGPTPAAVRPASAVSYVPSACLAGRVEVLRRLGGFDQGMRVAEDADLVWRVVGAGWTVRYEPGAQVRHEHRARPQDWWARKAYYGTGAALLADRHGPAVAPMVLSPWSAVAVVSLLAQRRWSQPVALGACAVATIQLRRRLSRAGRPWALAGTLVARGSRAALSQTGQSLVRHHWPMWALLATGSPRVRRVLLLAAVLDGARDPARVEAGLRWPAWMLLRRLDDAAYGAGVWWGSARSRSTAALRPQVTGRAPRRPAQSPPSGAMVVPDSSQTHTGSGPRSG